MNSTPHSRTKRPTPFVIFWTFLGSFFGIAAVAATDSLWLADADLTMVVGSFGATAVLLYAAQNSPLAQPFNVLVGHGVSALAGVTALQVVGGVDWLSASLAVAGAIAAMQVTRSVHPPGGATALIAVVGSEKIHALGYWYVLYPILSGAMTMLVVAFIMNNIPKGWKWPLFWV